MLYGIGFASCRFLPLVFIAAAIKAFCRLALTKYLPLYIIGIT